jgi:hypothetical protein
MLFPPEAASAAVKKEAGSCPANYEELLRDSVFAVVETLRVFLFPAVTL